MRVRLVQKQIEVSKVPGFESFRSAACVASSFVDSSFAAAAAAVAAAASLAVVEVMAAAAAVVGLAFLLFADLQTLALAFLGLLQQYLVDSVGSTIQIRNCWRQYFQRLEPFVES